MGGSLLDIISLAVFVFGALAFSVPAAYYWREWLAHPARPNAFAALSVACAVAFVSSLAFQFTLLYGGGAKFAAAISFARALSTGFLPPLLVHVAAVRDSRRWRWLLTSLYSASAFVIAAAVFGFSSSDIDYSTLLLLASCLAGLIVLALRRPAENSERAHRRWTAALFAALAICAAVTLLGYDNYTGSAPDYLLLAWFCISLYYLERLVFFDVLVKRGAFLAFGIAVIAICGGIAGVPWAYGAGLLLCWLAAPIARAAVERIIDRYWLRREYSFEEAERRFLEDTQSASTETELCASAAASLSRIFLCEASVRFDRDPAAQLAPRANGLPFLSGDRKLLESIERSLGILRDNVRHREERRRLEELAQRAELKALRAQIDPHFLFNTLSAITGLLHYHPELAEETVERLAQVFRYTLRQSQREWARLADEVEFASAYLHIEQARFGDRLRIHFYADESLGDLLIPAISIQPLVENAIRHGASRIAETGEVSLAVVRRGECVFIEITDNGPGFPPGFSLDGNGEGHGLRNVAERLRGYYGDAARLHWERRDGRTRVAIELPAAIPEPAWMTHDARSDR